MANFPVYHGITLAANAYVENLVVEKLAADPVPVEAGRVWYNTTLRVFRQSTLDGTGAVVVRTFVTVEELTAAIDAEVTARTAADLVLQGNLDAETTARTNADATLQANLLAEATARANADATLQLAIEAVDNKVAALGSAFNYVATVSGGADAGTAFDLGTLLQKDAGDYYKVTTSGYFKIGAEGTPFYANQGDGLVWNLNSGVDKIDNTDSAVQGTTSFIEVTGSADTGYTVDIDDAFKGRVSNLEANLLTETTARTAADLVLQGNLDAEITARTAADATLQAAIATEVTARTAADAVLQGEIGDITTLTTTVRTNVVGAINELNGLIAGGTQDVRNDYNATIYTFDSKLVGGGTPATTYNITHALANAFTDVSVFVERVGGSGVYFNDVVSVEQVSNNQLTVYLTSAQHIKVIVRSAATI